MALTLPPLNAVRAFEAAARSGSYVAAASELGVSPAAVSQQVRHLEEFLGKQLFQRFNNRVVLTDAGQAVFRGTSESLATLSAMTEQVMSGRVRSRLVISCISSMAERWLQPRLARLAVQPGMPRFELRVEDDPVDFGRYDIDIRLSYGSGLYLEIDAIPLFVDNVVPMCAPGYLAAHPEVANRDQLKIPDEDLIHTNWGPSFGSHPTWREWFQAAGMAHVPDNTGYQTDMSALALDFARDGVGVALGQKGMAADDIAAGRLVVLSDVSLPLGHPYSLIIPTTKRRKVGIRMVIDGLKNR